MTRHVRLLRVFVALLCLEASTSADDKSFPALDDLKTAEITAVRMTTDSRSATKSIVVASDGSRTLIEGTGPKAKSWKVKDIAPQDRDRLFVAALSAIRMLPANGPSSQLSDTISYELIVEFGNRSEYGSVRAIVETDKELLTAFEQIIATIGPTENLFNIDELRVRTVTKKEYPRFDKRLTDADLRGDISQIVKTTGKWSVRFSRLGGDHARVSVLDEGPIMIRWGAEEVPIRSVRGNDMNAGDRALFVALAEKIRDDLPHVIELNPNFELIIGCGSRRQSIKFKGLAADDPKQMERITAFLKLVQQCVPSSENVHFTTEELLIRK